MDLSTHCVEVFPNCQKFFLNTRVRSAIPKGKFGRTLKGCSLRRDVEIRHGWLCMKRKRCSWIPVELCQDNIQRITLEDKMTKKSVYMLDPDNFLSKVSIVGVPSLTCKNSTIWVEILILRIQNYATGLPKRHVA